jgi:hypothetical protein
MTIAVMQPYLFPYLGYFQLIHAVDKFIVYDDVTFIKQGWINRNNILLNGKPFLFTVPLVNASSNTLICDTLINRKGAWEGKLLRTVQQAYRKAPFFRPVYELLEGVLNQQTDHIGHMATTSLKEISKYLGLSTSIQESSRLYGNNVLKAQDRVLDICKIEGANHYINPIGGGDLYSKEAFSDKGVILNFIKTGDIQYAQYGEPFVPWLSIIDVLMFNDVVAIGNMLNKYELL